MDIQNVVKRLLCVGILYDCIVIKPPVLNCTRTDYLASPLVIAKPMIETILVSWTFGIGSASQIGTGQTVK